MPKAETTRNYPFSDGDLKQKCDEVKTSVTRDADDFATRGVTTGVLDDFQDSIGLFDDFPTDEELEGVVMEATENKLTRATDLRKQVRTVRGIAADTFGEKGKYRSFGFEGMDK